MLKLDARSQEFLNVGSRRFNKRIPALVVVAFGGMLAMFGLALAGHGNLLPMAAGMLAAAGLSIAAIAWITGASRKEHMTTSWDVAGLLVLLGCAAAIIAD